LACLQKDGSKRLGGNIGVIELKKHPWLKDLKE